MKKEIRFGYFLIIPFLLCFCSGKNEDASFKDIDFSSIDQILILGNSMTVHQPKPEIGWEGSWGMAASAPENDYIHLLATQFKQWNPSIQLSYFNIAEFERSYWNYNFSNLDSLTGIAPDLLIINLGENVKETKAQELNFGYALLQLRNHFTDTENTETVFIGSFWPKSTINFQIQKLCETRGYRFVPIADLFNDKSNIAAQNYSHEGVGNHPSDQGMKKIAERIISHLKNK